MSVGLKKCLKGNRGVLGGDEYMGGVQHIPFGGGACDGGLGREKRKGWEKLKALVLSR